MDHGAQAPFTAKARMLVTFGLSLNSVMANTENMRGDVHGGANEQAVELFHMFRLLMDISLLLWIIGLRKMEYLFWGSVTVYISL